MDKQTLIARWQKKQDANMKETDRQMEFIGVRLGVAARLKELERERTRIERRLNELGGK